MNMGFCQYCGKPLADNASFCPACGKPVAATGASPSLGQPQAPIAGMPRNIASEGDRIVAIILDSIIVGLFSLVIFIPLLIAGIAIGGFAFGPFSFLFGPSILIYWLLWLLYFTYFESTTGQTFGKQIMKIKVVDETTMQHLDFGRAFVRSILRIIDWLPFFYLIGFILIVTNDKKQRLGDMAAHSIVVKI